MGASNTAALIIGGRSPYVGNTEYWNGSSWTELADLSSARYNATGIGTAFTGIFAGGSTSGAGGSTTTEEWTVPESISNLTITD